MILWGESTCPKCNNRNFVHLGDKDGDIVPNVEAIECFECGHCFWAEEEDAYDENGEENDIQEAYIEEGVEDPKEHY